ncbi:sodium:solute symporter family protein [Candidatus Formimonas warabiya]|uniref:Sodium:solute symporter family protein n=1 Tax=Formimonas warabiya TaxID=1761012 RepID=A0A3G1KWA7_FORW1|nr:hypothetical protein [Candidatus Formimonas warabiya]ATW26778.1 hypothetical protein DCMF_20200 [Candidatus Formimonas warabiya]
MEMTNQEIIISCLFLAVFLVVFIYAAFFWKSSKLEGSSMEEFAVGSRTFSYFIVLCTLIGCFLTAGMYTGWFSWGMYEGLISQYLLVYGIASFFVMYIFSTRIWVWGKNFNLLTQPDFIQLRFRSKPLTLISAISGIIIEAPWCIIEMAALGWAVTAVTGGLIPKEIGIIFFTALIIAYTTYGGIKAVAGVEVLKGILVIVIVIGGSIAAIYKLVGGFGPMFHALMSAAPQNMTFNTGGTYSYSYWNSIIITGTLGCFGWISMFARIYTARSVAEVKKAASGGAILLVIVCALLLLLATATYLVPGALDLPDPNMSFFYVFEKAFGPFFLGISGILVIITAIGLIGLIVNAHAIVISENIIRELKPDMKDENRRKVTRWCIVGYSLIVMAVAMMDLPNLAHIAITFYEGIVQIIPLILFGIFWKRANKWSVGIGYVAGLVIAISIAAFPAAFPWAGGWTGGIYGFVVNILINIVLGFVIKQDTYVDELFEIIESYEEDSQGNAISQVNHNYVAHDHIG